MNKKIKVLFPENVETITISKNDYDRLYGQLTYENIKLQQEKKQLKDNWNKLKEYIKELEYYSIEQEPIWILQKMQELEDK